MKWNKLPDKTPPFETDLVGWRHTELEGKPNLNVDCWLPVVLMKIEEGPKGKSFIFENQITKDHIEGVTHWAIPSKPKE